MLIDSHHHLWRYTSADYPWISEAMPALKQDFWSTELRELAAANGVDGFVAVQARQTLDETQDLLDLADDLDLVHGVVGWVDFQSADIESQIERFSSHSKLRGFRHVVQDEPDDRFILNNAFNRGIDALEGTGLVYDVLVYARQLPATIEFVRCHPNIPMVIDHIAKPTIAGQVFDSPWQENMSALAAFPNVTCKFSGVATEVRDPEWSEELIRPYWETVLELFTPARLMFGSDWPVCLLRTDYTRWLHTAQSLAGKLSSSEQQQLFSSTAIETYQLEQP
ncbi:amidohydrolase family protein [Rhodopirellula sp. MGV]|uniref:amidohydrolase family protein n=1 Tax=Rhodopirellula sp. MGV TaxID=2023130 RepID=UPI000B978A0A|nr:amidohydrolase family protein [Rhodopirellula sp. MGV]OYP35825.1 amidohydrolase [Rhodopirellula sp. MGV]PNY36362.1 amidohydrolase [Rhodopirellula baltica]